MKMKTKFNSYVYPDDIIQLPHNKLYIVAKIHFDYGNRPNDFECYSAEHIAAWKNDEWFYCGIALEVWRHGVCLDEYAASLWGIEANFPGTNNSYLTAVAYELLPEAIKRGEEILAKLCGDEPCQQD